MAKLFDRFYPDSDRQIAQSEQDRQAWVLASLRPNHYKISLDDLFTIPTSNLGRQLQHQVAVHFSLSNRQDI